MHWISGGEERRRFESFVAEVSDGLVRTGYLMTGDLSEAEDLVQETLLRCARNWRRLRSMEYPAAYGRRILVHLVIDGDGRRRRRTSELETGTEDLDRHADNSAYSRPARHRRACRFPPRTRGACRRASARSSCSATGRICPKRRLRSCSDARWVPSRAPRRGGWRDCASCWRTTTCSSPTRRRRSASIRAPPHDDRPIRGQPSRCVRPLRRRGTTHAVARLRKREYGLQAPRRHRAAGLAALAVAVAAGAAGFVIGTRTPTPLCSPRKPPVSRRSGSPMPPSRSPRGSLVGEGVVDPAGLHLVGASFAAAVSARRRMHHRVSRNQRERATESAVGSDRRIRRRRRLPISRPEYRRSTSRFR